jgi:hypothetical protein
LGRMDESTGDDGAWRTSVEVLEYTEVDSMAVSNQIDTTPATNLTPNKRKRTAKLAIAREPFRSSHRAQLSLQQHEGMYAHSIFLWIHQKISLQSLVA